MILSVRKKNIYIWYDICIQTKPLEKSIAESYLLTFGSYIKVEKTLHIGISSVSCDTLEIKVYILDISSHLYLSIIKNKSLCLIKMTYLAWQIYIYKRISMIYKSLYYQQYCNQLTILFSSIYQPSILSTRIFYIYQNKTIINVFWINKNIF